MIFSNKFDLIILLSW